MDLESRGTQNNVMLLSILCSGMSVLVLAASNGPKQCIKSNALHCFPLPTCSIYVQPSLWPTMHKAYSPTAKSSHCRLARTSRDCNGEVIKQGFCAVNPRGDNHKSAICYRPKSLASSSAMGSCVTNDTALKILLNCVKTKEFFSFSYAKVLGVLHAAFPKELEYLHTAYAATSFGNPDVATPSPSQVLFGTKLPEVDRTLTGVMSLRWIYDNDYKSFTQNQNSAVRLSEESFSELRDFFFSKTDNFDDYQAVFVVIMMMMTNDLGKSSSFEEDLSARLPVGISLSQNHDMVMFQALQHCADLVPSFGFLLAEQQSSVRKLIQLSATFNPAQLVQGECPPAAVDTLLELQLSPEEVDLKFMELYLDVAGARGHVNHEGAATMIEPVFKSFQKALKLSSQVALRHMTTQEAYDSMLAERLVLLGLHWDVTSSREAYIKARLFCMGRVDNKATAETFEAAYMSLSPSIRNVLEKGLTVYGHPDEPAIQPTYMPAMFELALKSPHPQPALATLLTYLSRVLHASKEDMKKVPDSQGAVIFERSVREILDPLIALDEFKQDPAAVIHEGTPLPELTVAKWAVQKHTKLVICPPKRKSLT